MAHILIDLIETEINELIEDLRDKVLSEGHSVSIISSVAGLPISKGDYSEILESDVLIILYNSKIPESYYWSKLKDISETSLSDDKLRPALLLGYPPAVEIPLPVDLNIFDFYQLPEDWRNNLYLQSSKIFKRINEWLSPNSNNKEILIKREIKANIEQNAPEFVNNAIKELEKRGKNLNITANFYFIIGILSISLSIYLSCSTIQQFIDYLKIANPWPIVTFLIVKGIIIISLFVALSKYAVLLGKAYMHESLKIKERIHAISFGQFYLNVYKEGVTPEDLKDVFRDWNLSNQNSAFSSNETKDFDPKLIESVTNIIEKSKGLVKTATESTKS